MSWTFWGSLAQEAAGGRAAWLSGEQQGIETRRQRELEDEERKRAQRREQRDAAQAARQAELDRLRMEAARQQQREAGRLTGPGGRTFDNTPEGQAGLLDWQRRYNEANRQPRQAPDPATQRRQSYDYWSKVADDLVTAHGPQALRVSSRTDRPDLRAARQGGDLTEDMIRAAYERRRAESTPSALEQQRELEFQAMLWDAAAQQLRAQGKDPEAVLGPRPLAPEDDGGW